MANYAIAGWLLLVAGYSGWLAVSSNAVGWFVWCLALVAVAIGLVFDKRWARYCTLAFAVIDVVVWIALTLYIAHLGWPYQDAFSTFVSLVPGLLWASIWTAVGVRMYKDLQRTP